MTGERSGVAMDMLSEMSEIVSLHVRAARLREPECGDTLSLLNAHPADQPSVSFFRRDRGRP